MKNLKKVNKGEILIPNRSTFFARLYQSTPSNVIKTRPGRGGINFKYVEGGYVKKELNEIFQGLWDFRILWKKIGKTQVVVEGELTCHLIIGKDNEGRPILHKIVKTQYGGSDIKTNSAGRIMSIADDLKSASTDALKKCASELGVASDVYWSEEVNNIDPTIIVEKAETVSEQQDLEGGVPMITDKQLKYIHLLASKAGIQKKDIKEKEKIESFKDLTRVQAKKVIEKLLGKKKKDTKINLDDIPF